MIFPGKRIFHFEVVVVFLIVLAVHVQGLECGDILRATSHESEYSWTFNRNYFEDLNPHNFGETDREEGGGDKYSKENDVGHSGEFHDGVAFTCLVI